MYKPVLKSELYVYPKCILVRLIAAMGDRFTKDEVRGLLEREKAVLKAQNPRAKV